MSKIIKKQPMAAMLSADPEDLSEKDKLALLKEEYKVAVQTTPDYLKAKTEIGQYFVELPTNPDLKDLSEINKLYAMTQSFSSRVTSIEVSAIDNQSRWERLVNLLEGYLEDKQYELLNKDEYSDMTNMKAEAAVKNALYKERRTLRKFKDKENEAASFVRMITTKKKDLASVLVTLSKQVKALSLEHATNPMANHS
jgi:hypothetical protein